MKRNLKIEVKPSSVYPNQMNWQVLEKRMFTWEVIESGYVSPTHENDAVECKETYDQLYAIAEWKAEQYIAEVRVLENEN